MLKLSIVPIDGMHSHEIYRDVDSGMGGLFLRLG